MARKNDTPQKAAMRELMGGCLKQNNVKIITGTKPSTVRTQLTRARRKLKDIMEGEEDV